jgi:hypothetical protein
MSSIGALDPSQLRSVENGEALSAGPSEHTAVFERPEYLAASAAHVGARVEPVQAAGAGLPLLRLADGGVRTVYGLPRPFGSVSPDGLAALAGELAALAGELAVAGSHVTTILSPLGSGPVLARRLLERGARCDGERPIALLEFGAGDPESLFERRGRRAIRTAQARGGRASMESLAPWFGSFYRAAMRRLRAEPVYFFSDTYFNALAALPHYVVCVEDAYGVAAATLFLHDSEHAYYHLGGRRDGAEPVAGAMSLALGEGIREAWRRGCRAAVLGGGRSDDPADPLLAFKRQLAPVTRPRITATLEPRRALETRSAA